MGRCDHHRLTFRVGTWDGANKFTKKVVQAHTNLTEIDQSLDLLWRSGVDARKVVLGLGFYGRAFTLQDPSCDKPGCPFAGGAKKGKCTGESGILSNSEIQDVISERKVTPTLIAKDAIKYISWDSDQWVSYDEETLRMKKDYANKLCLGGTMVWALDLDKPGRDTSINKLIGSGSLDSKWNSLSSKRAITRSNSMTLGLFWSTCQPIGTPYMCPKGYRAIAYGHGKVFDADMNHLTGEGCHGGNNAFKSPGSKPLTKCRWRHQWLPEGSVCCGECAIWPATVGPRREIQSLQQQVSTGLGYVNEELTHHRTETWLRKR